MYNKLSLMKFIKKILDYLKHHKKRVLLAIAILGSAIFILKPNSAPEIPTEIVKTGEIKQTVSSTGAVAAKKSVNLVFQIPGLVSYVGVKKGDYVKQYQTIAVIDQRTLVKNLQNKLIDYSLQRNSFDQTIDDHDGKKPKDALNDTMKRILENNQYNLDKAIVSVELQDLAKQQSVLTTPIEGIVSRADIETAGVVAQANTTYTVVDPESVVFNMDVDEADVAKIQVGQQVTVILDAYPDSEITLQVTNIDFVYHSTSTGGTAYTVELVLGSNENYKYRVGMGGEGEILIERHTDVPIVPLTAIFDENHIYVKTKSGYEDKKIQLGLQNETDAEILSGLNIGDEIVLQPDLVKKQKQAKKLF